MHSGKFCMYSGTFWNILEHSGTVHYYIECCKKLEFQLGTHTHTQTDGHTGSSRSPVAKE